MKRTLLLVGTMIFFLLPIPAQATNDSRQVGETFSLTATQLMKLKQGGMKEYTIVNRKKLVTAILYRETWFGMKNVLTQYVLNDKQQVQQITLTINRVNAPYKTIDRLTDYLGESVNGRTNREAPPFYYAWWRKESVFYNLQFYGNYIDIYITPCHYQSNLSFGGTTL